MHLRRKKFMAEASLAPADAPLTLIQGEPITQRPARVLLGWLPQQDAIRQLLGRSPAPQEDLTALSQMISSAHSAVLRRPTITVGDSVIGGDRSLLDEVATHPEIRANFPDVRWRVEWVDLTRVLSVQKMITTDGLDLRVADAVDD